MFMILISNRSNSLLLTTFAFFAILLMTLGWSSNCSAQINGDLSGLRNALFSAWEDGENLKVSLVRDHYEGLFALEGFISENLGFEYYSKNRVKIAGWVDKSGVVSALDSAATEVIPDKKIRRNTVSKFNFSGKSMAMAQNFQNQLCTLVEALRGPDGQGNYLYATHVKRPGAKIENQRLVATHGMNPLNYYEKSFFRKIYRIHIYSPSKRGLFGGNRDSWLGELQVDYQSEGQPRQYVRKLNRVLKRGESLDVELPEIADCASIRLSFGCKPEHAGKAELYVEVIEPLLQDDMDSPYHHLVKAIQNFSVDPKVKPLGAQVHIENLLREIRTTAMNMGAYQAAAIPAQVTVVTPVSQTPAAVQSGSAVNPDSVRYFFYMLADPGMTRESLQNKYRELFMSGQ